MIESDARPRATATAPRAGADGARDPPRALRSRGDYVENGVISFVLFLMNFVIIFFITWIVFHVKVRPPTPAPPHAPPDSWKTR
jgi:hypothetical protein